MFIPKLFTTLKGYSRQQFLKDSSAGLIVALIAFPLSIALGVASGVSPETGLYTAVIGCTLVALLGGSRVQVAGPTGAFVVVVLGIISQYGFQGLAGATILAGIMLIIMGLAKLGDVITMIPYPITTGFTSGIAVTIGLTQLPDFLGLAPGGEENLLLGAWSVLSSIGQSNWWAVLVGITTLGVYILWPKLHTPIPGALVAIIVGTLVSVVFQLPVQTIGSRFGSLSRALPQFSLPGLDLAGWAALWKPGVTIAVLAAIESLLSAVVADGMIGGNHRSNMELIAQGSGNIVSGLFGGLPVTGAIARTAANIKSGGRTPVAALTSGIFLFVMLQLLLPLASRIPMSSLAAVLLMVAFSMGEWEYFGHIRKAPKSDYGVFLATFGLTVVFDLIVGILVGFVLAMLLFMRRMASVSSVELIADNDQGRSDRLFHIPGSSPPKNTVIYRIRGPFFFGAAEKFLHVQRQLGEEVERVILDLSGVPVIDATAYRALELMAIELGSSHGVLVICGLQTQPRTALERYDFFGLPQVQMVEGDIEAGLLSLKMAEPGQTTEV